MWPSELTDRNSFLKLFLADGRSRFDKDKLAVLLQSILPLSLSANEDQITKTECVRCITSAILLTSTAISSFSNENNYFAEIEAWTVCQAYVLATIERWNLKKDIQKSLNVTSDTIYNSLTLLCEELMERTHFVEGDAISDKVVYRLRITLLIGLMSTYALWRKEKKEMVSKHDEFIKKFCLEKMSQMVLWGEAAIPQFLSLFWYLKTIDATPLPDSLIRNLANTIAVCNHPRSKNPISNPYFDENSVIPRSIGISDENIHENFQGCSFSIESLIHIITRRKWRQWMNGIWPDVSRLGFCFFIPDERWQYYLWNSEKGLTATKFPPLTKKWDDIRREADEINNDNIPHYFINNPISLLIFLIVFPHRLRTDTVRLLDNHFCQI